MSQNPCKTKPAHCHECPAFEKSVFHGLGEAELNELAARKTAGAYSRGDSLSKQGDPADFVYCMSSGITKVSRSTVGSSAQSIVRIAAAGDLLGYRCIFSQKSFRATAQSFGESVACKIDAGFIFHMIEKDSNFSRELLSRMGQEIAAAEDHHHSFCQKNVRERLAEALLLLNKKCGTEVEKGRRLDIQMSRTELANWIGTAKETAVRTLSEFKEEKLIEQVGEFLVITNLKRLSEIAN